MTSHGKYNSEQLNNLLNLKEQEWRSALQEHVDTLVKELAEKDELVTLEKLRFHKLKEDFEYNLKLLEDRDKDLKEYEDVFEKMKNNDNLSNQQVSDMKIKVDEFQIKINLLQKEKEEMQHHYQMRLKHYQEEVNQFYKKKEEEHQKEKNEYEELKRKLQRKIRDTEEELEFEKQKMLKQLDESIRQKEQEFQIKLDQNDTEIHSYQIKVKMLSHELDIVRSSNTEVAENFENNKVNVVQLERLLKEKEWELQDSTNMKDLKIKELEVQLNELQKSVKWKTEEFERRYCELEKLSNEKERLLSNLRSTADDNELQLREDVKSIYQQKEEMELNFKRLQWQLSDMQMEKEKEIQSYINKIELLEKHLKEEIDTLNKTTVAKDLELEAVKSSEDILKKESNKLKTDFTRLKKDLTLALDRERILESAKVQLELDWRRRYETKETDLYDKHEQEVRNISEEKDKAIHAKKQMENELSRRENLIKLLEDDKAIAIKCLNDNGINTETIFADGVPERDTETAGKCGNPADLQNQNYQLKEVIKEMRAEMELLSQQITSNTSTPNKANGEKSNYVKDLEAELQDLKASNRNLLLKLEDLTKEDKPPLDSAAKANAKLTDPGIKSYVKELNQTIGVLRNDKVLLTASINSKNATINHLNDTVGKLNNEKQQQVVLIDNLKFDMASKTKVFEQNISSLKSRISELELHLQQARSEAEIYYKSVMERNSDATQASNQLSDLKLQQSAFSHLPSQLIPAGDGKSSFYKEKLKLAVERIKELTVERSQLINVGNKIRAELAKLKDNSRRAASSDQDQDKLKSSNMRQYGQQIQSKLEQIEQMNFEATTKQLRQEPKRKMDVNVKLMSSSSDISEIMDDRPTKDDAPEKESAKDNRPPSPLRTSSEHSSINEIWRLLENADDISSVPDNERSEEMALVGKHINPDARKTVSKSPVLKAKRLGKGNKKSVIRNYNQKDDT